MYSLCKQGMVPTNLVVHAVEHCIKQMDKGSLDCLQQYYIEMLNIHRYESPEFCLKLIPMLQDVPELNSNKRKDDLQTLHHIMRQMKTKSLNRQPYKINHQRPSYMQKSEPENRPVSNRVFIVCRNIYKVHCSSYATNFKKRNAQPVIITKLFWGGFTWKSQELYCLLIPVEKKDKVC